MRTLFWQTERRLKCSLPCVSSLQAIRWSPQPAQRLLRSPFSSANHLPHEGAINGGHNLNRIKIKDILKKDWISPAACVGARVKVCGWVRTIREQKMITFIEINDGSTLSGIQGVLDADTAVNNSIRAKLSTGTAIEVIGQVVSSIGKNQVVEIAIANISIVGECPPDSYPLQKKRHTLEYLRSIAHLRPRTNTLGAVARIRSSLAFAAHSFFQNEGFLYLQSPIITASDCEGAGEMFRVTSLPIDSPLSIPLANPSKKDTTESTESHKTDFSEDFFKKAAFLTVSGQLSAEAFACAVGDVYTFGPTFRAEKSQTTRHLAEFNMIEPEMAFSDTNAAMANAESFLKYVVKRCRDQCEEDLKFFESFYDEELSTRLNELENRPFHRIPYREAVALLQKEISVDRRKWAFPDLNFGDDLQTEHERWLAEVYCKGCVFVYDYPKQIKSFYMRNNSDGETVASFDLLVPGVGELMGGAQREERYDILLEKINDFKLSPSDYQWYLDLRRFGTVPHAGYGVGFERLVCYVTGIENIRDAIAFPRYIDHADF